MSYTAEGLTDKLQFIGEFAAVGRALTKTFIHKSAYGRKPLSGLNKRLYIRSYENQFSTT